MRKQKNVDVFTLALTNKGSHSPIFTLDLEITIQGSGIPFAEWPKSVAFSLSTFKSVTEILENQAECTILPGKFFCVKTVMAKGNVE